MQENDRSSWDQIVRRKDTHSIKWDAMGPFIGKSDLMPFWVADMDFKSPDSVVKALSNRAEHGVFGYTYDDSDALDAFASWCSQRHELKVLTEWIVRSPGVVTAIGLALQSFTNEGDGIVIQPPVYPQFAEMITVNDRKILNNPLKIVDDFAEMDLVHLEELFKAERPKMMIFCNPHNPVGRVWPRETVQAVVNLCIAYEVYLFSDEIHCDLLFSGKKFHSALDAEGGESRWVMAAMAPSKTFNIAGLFYSMILIPDEEQRKTFKKVMDRLHLFPVNCFNETAAKAAYSGGEQWLDDLLVYLEGNYQCLSEILAEKMPEVRLCKMEGTYLAWLDFREWFHKGYPLKRFMIDQAGVAVNDGRAFGSEGEGFVRFNFGCPRAVMLEGLGKIYEARQAML